MKPTFTGVVLVVPALWLAPEQAAARRTATARPRPLSRPAVLISETSYHPVEIEDPHILARESRSCKRDTVGSDSGQRNKISARGHPDYTDRAIVCPPADRRGPPTAPGGGIEVRLPGSGSKTRWALLAACAVVLTACGDGSRPGAHPDQMPFNE